ARVREGGLPLRPRLRGRRTAAPAPASRAQRALMRTAWRILALAVLAQFGVSVVDQGVPLLNGFVKSELHASAAVAGLAVSSFAFGKILGYYTDGLAA